MKFSKVALTAKIAAKVAALVMGVGVFGCASARSQDVPTPIPFTLSWEANSTISTQFLVHSLRSYNSQPVNYPTCGRTPEGYNVWCGEVVHYASNPAADSVDFNFPDNFLLESCSLAASQYSTVYTSPTRRTITVNSTFSCADANGAPWTIQTTMLTKQYLAACRFRGCWGTFVAGQQSPITGTVTQD